MLASLMVVQPRADPARLPLLLDVVVNGQRIGKLGEFQSRDGVLFATRRELGELGLRPGAGDPEEVVAVGSLPGVSGRLDGPTQTAIIVAATPSLKPTILGPAPVDRATLPVESGFGAVVDYDVAGTYAAGRSRVDTFWDARVFSPWGVLSSEAIVRAGAGSNAGVRLDTTYTYSDPQTMQRVRVGDVITSGLVWTRPLRLGGAQFTRDFTLRPDLITYPIPSIAGQVTVPSTVDVLVNGTQLLTTRAEPGPFEVRQLPVINGVNDVALVVNDALGRQVTESVPIYASTTLLASGLDAYSVEAGAVRLGYGFSSADYRAPAGSASYRRGVADWLTLSAHAEGGGALAMGGVGAAAALGSAAVASVAAAGSTIRGKTGLLAYAAVERITRKLSLSVSAQWTDGRFGDLASLYDDPVPSQVLRASAGYALGSAGTVAVAYTRQRRNTITRPPLFGDALGFNGVRTSAGALTGPIFYLPSRTSLVTVSYSAPLPFGNAAFYATAFHDFENRSGSGALFGFTMPLGARNAVGAGVGLTAGSATGTLQATRSVIAVGDAGGQLYATQGGDRRVLATAQYKSPWSLLELNGYHAAGGTAWRGSARGALAFTDTDVFASNVITDSFAVVDTDGVAGLDVLYENRPVQRTGSSGRVLVPDLRSFEVNQVSVDPAGLPFDVDIGEATRLVRPADRSGVVLRFAARRSDSALLRVVDEAGEALPLGTTLHPEAGGPPVPVGHGGEAFVRDLPSYPRFRAEVPGKGACSIAFDYRATPGDIPTVGPLRCVRVAR